MHFGQYRKLRWGEDKALIVDLLRKNEVVISSTDTVYGFLGNTTEKSYRRILELKRIEKDRPFLVLIGSIEKIFEFVDIKNVSDRIIKFLSNCWPGPITILFRAKRGLPDFMVSNGTIAIRFPNHSGLISILSEFDALFSTSANRAGEVAPASFSQISYEILREIRYVIVDEPEKPSSRPSTIIDLSDGELKIVRAGDSVERLEEMYG